MNKEVKYRLVAIHSEDERTNYIDSISPLGPFAPGDGITFHEGSLIGTFAIDEVAHDIVDGSQTITQTTTLYVSDLDDPEAD